jgi:exodeoxyribonuclease VII large subunit
MLDLRASLQNSKTRLVAATLKLLAEQKTLLASLASQLRYVSPERRIQSARQRVDELARRAHAALFHTIELQAIQLKGMERRLAALNPLAVLRRGYAVVTRKEDGGVVSHVAQASAEMKVRVSDGEFEIRKSQVADH